MHRISLAVALTALVAALGGTAIAAGPSGGTTLHMRVSKDGKLVGNGNDGTVKKAGVGIYDITFDDGVTGSKVPLDLSDCAITATPEVTHESTPEEVAADADVQRLSPNRIFVETTRPLPLGTNKITPFLTNAAVDVAVVC